MYYLDTSVLLAYTLTRQLKPARHAATAQLFTLVNTGQVRAVTSFYALHELLVIAISNTDPDWEASSELARQALLEILASRVLLLPIPRREDKMLKARLFSVLRDATDLPHAIAAHVAGCTALVAYDEHFRAINHVIRYLTPEELLTTYTTLTS